MRALHSLASLPAASLGVPPLAAAVLPLLACRPFLAPTRQLPADLFGLQAEVSVLCYSPWYTPEQWRLFAHLPIVDTAGIW